jgi:exonuclease VII small subunit
MYVTHYTNHVDTLERNVERLEEVAGELEEYVKLLGTPHFLV